MIKLGFRENAEGDFNLILSKYHFGDGEILLTDVLGSIEEVQREFGKLERLITSAKAKALKLVTPMETKRRMDRHHRL